MAELNFNVKSIPASSLFAFKLKAIKDQLDQENHPLSMLITTIKTAFTRANVNILYNKELRPLNNVNGQTLSSQLNQADKDGQTNAQTVPNINCDLYMNESKRCIQELKTIITIIEEVFLDFYDLRKQIKTRVNRE